MSRKDLLDTLHSGVESLGMSVSDKMPARMLAYIDLVGKWNRVYNLTAVKGRRNLLIRHLLDSLTVRPHLCGVRILDIGSGAGMPGIPLALAAPELELVLLDSNAKRIRFLRQVVAELALDNVTLVQQRVQEYRSTEKFDTLVSRAYASLADMIESSGHLLSDDGCIIAMKGIWPGDETTAIPEGFHIDRVIDTHVPELNEQRHLVLCRRDN
ncbi:MAG TPA: 16S rRNA (guanine(527)-N(7))-methyltransferase RsmG [Gammaproteobacteria bacterium]|nr:16S rRNA (guanine(527)-N(7))-methyltransferase RsmG [Gammaproteobacteria bacterium]